MINMCVLNSVLSAMSEYYVILKCTIEKKRTRIRKAGSGTREERKVRNILIILYPQINKNTSQDRGV